MLERETDLIIQTIIARTIGSKESITLREFLEADVPAGIKVYTAAEVTHWLTRDLQASPSFARLDRTSSIASQLSKSFLRALALSYVFPRQELLTMVDNAVHFLENFLCRPQWTLEHFMFEQKNVMPVDIVCSKLEYVVEYTYFKKLLERVLRQRGREEVTSGDFRELLMKIDDQVVKQHNPRELAQLLKPMFDFLHLSAAPLDAPIPLKPILVFFDDKKMKILREYIEEICRVREKSEISQHELTGLIEDLYLGQPDQASETPAPAVPPPPPSPPERESQERPTAETAARADRSTQNIALSLTFSGMQESKSPPPPPLPDLNEFIPAEQRATFIRKIFRKDEEYYTGIIASLNGFRTWKDATQYLTQLFEINGLDPYAPEVVEFTDAVQRRFQTEKPDVE